MSRGGIDGRGVEVSSTTMPIATTHPTRIPTVLLLASALACGSPADTSTGDTGTGSTQSSGPGGTSTGEAPTSSATTEPATTSSGTTGQPGTETGSTGAGEGDTDTTAADTSTGEPGSTGTTSGGTDTIGGSSGDTGDTGATGDTGGSTGTTGDPDGFGVISGECGLIDAMELESPSPFVFTSAIDFGVIGYDYDLLTPGGQQIADEGGLNDGSLQSEIVAYEVLARCDMAVLLKTEAKIIYQNPMGKKTDLLVEFDGLKIGVSVMRAIGFPKDDPYTVAQATTILKKKLGDIQISSVNVAPEDAWAKQILSVVAYTPMHVDSVLTAYAALDPMLKADTILVVSVSNGDDTFIYD